LPTNRRRSGPKTWSGSRSRAKTLSHGAPLIRVKGEHLGAAGVVRVPRIVGVRDGLPLLDDGRVVDVTNVVWCTGFHPGFSWIDLPLAFEENGAPRNDGGLVESEPGLYFVGLHFLYAFSSVMIHGVGSDAARIVKTIATRMRRTQSVEFEGLPTAYFSRGIDAEKSSPRHENLDASQRQRP
jgi:putative flavoprotein involved in K+ transport